jgi:hypothetical protein
MSELEHIKPILKRVIKKIKKKAKRKCQKCGKVQTAFYFKIDLDKIGQQ